MTQEYCPSCGFELPEQRGGEALIDCPECGYDLLGSDEPAEESLDGKALLMMGGAALVGAAVWAGVAIGTGREIGWLAWGIGALVGWACIKGGGYGLKAAVVACVFVVISIVAGRAVGLNVLRHQHLDEMFESQAAVEYRNMLKAEGELYRELRGADEDAVLQAFLEEQGYAPEDGSDSWSAESLRTIRAELVPDWLTASSPGGEEKLIERQRRLAEREVTLWTYFREQLGWIDLLFLALGVGTAFRMALGR